MKVDVLEGQWRLCCEYSWHGGAKTLRDDTGQGPCGWSMVYRVPVL